MSWNNGGLRIAMRPVQDSSQLHSVAAGIPTSVVILLGVALSFSLWFPSVLTAWHALFLGMLTLSAILWLLQLTGKGRWVCIGTLVLIATVSVVFHKQVLAGMGCLGNDLLAQLTRMTGRIWLDFAAAEETFVLWGIVPVLAVITVLLHLTMQTGNLLFFLPVILPVFVALLTGFFPVDAGAVLIGFGSILLLMRSTGKSVNGQGFWGVPSWLAVVLLCVTLSACAGAAFGDTNAKTDSWDRYFHNMLYDRDTNSMPEGNLKNLRKWNSSDTPALEITMSEPQKLYLRGQIYETYEGTAWLPLDTETKVENESLFYWLHESGFFGQSQIGIASAFTTQAAPAELTIENLSACSAHGYYPYALCESDVLDAKMIGDAQLPEAEMLLYQPGSVPEWYGVQHMLASAQGRNNIAQYLLAEEAYEEYVTKVDLQLTNESWSVLQRQLGEDENPKTLSQIREFIRNYLADGLVYDEEVKTLNGNSDFLQYTLEKSGSGYSVHYATAATLMLRYFGVPARYVEGYFLSAEEAATYRAGQPIVLTEKHAHAWAEYYLPGVGFVPFEVTPGYIDDEELEMGGSLSQNEQTYTGDHLKYAQVQQPERIEEPEQDRFSFSMKPIYLVYLLVMLLLALAVIIFVKRKKFKNALMKIDEASNREAIAMRFGYAKTLLLNCADIQVDGSEQAENLNREALFSNHEMTDWQRTQMDAFAADTLIACKEKWTIFQKLRYWAWDCLY